MAAAASDRAGEQTIALVRTTDQWLRCAHVGTALDAGAGCVELGPAEADDETGGTPPGGLAAGLAFDARCRLYHTRPEEGRLETVRPDPADPAGPDAAVRAAVAVDFVAAKARPQMGDFTVDVGAGDPGTIAGPLASPRGLAVTADDLLYVAETGRNRVLVYDLVDQRLAAVIRLGDEGAAGPRPVDLDVDARRGRVLVLTTAPAGVVELDAHAVVGRRVLPAAAVAPARLAVSAGGRLALLDPAAGRIFVDGVPGARALPAPAHATDVLFESEDVLVVAHWPGQDLRRVALDEPQPTRPRLRARGYDGRGITRAPDGRIAFWTGAGFRYAVPERRRFVTEGRVTTFQLDAGDWQATWGRVFVDACLPEGSNVRLLCAAADEPPEEAELARTPPVNAAGVAVPHPALSPPMPPLSFVPPDGARLLPLHRRAEGNELPWPAADTEDRFVTLEAPVQSAPRDGRPAPTLRGRYLWITLRLTGDGRVTPRVRCVRAETRGHDTLRRLPKIYAADPEMESFLNRYLAMLAGFLGETDARGFARAALLNPDATPAAALPWLASFLGLVLDERWARAPRAGGRSADARRQLVAEANCLFRFRGTVAGLRRFIEIYAGVPVTIHERFRERGLGGAVLGTGGAAGAPAAVLGAGLRVGGTRAGEGAAAGANDADAFRTHAHRFAVLLPAVLTDEQLEVVRDIVTVHRPAHTLFEICPIGLGTRLGLGAHLDVSSFIGRGGRFQPARVGDAVLGPGTVVGRPRSGMPLGLARLNGGARAS